MSRMRIKNPMRTKKEKKPIVSFRQVCVNQLQIRRNNIKAKDDKKVEELVEDKTLKEDGSYKHVQNVARDLDWSTSRVFRSLERLANYKRITEQIKKQIEYRAKQNMDKLNEKEAYTGKPEIMSTPTEEVQDGELTD